MFNPFDLYKLFLNRSARLAELNGIRVAVMFKPETVYRFGSGYSNGLQHYTYSDETFYLTFGVFKQVKV